MKKIIFIFLLLTISQNIVSAQQCQNCGSCGITLQMRCEVCPQGKLYDVIRRLYFSNRKISMRKYRQCATEIANVMGFEYDGTLKGNLRILNTCSPYNFEIFFSDDLNEMLIQEHIEDSKDEYLTK